MRQKIAAVVLGLLGLTSSAAHAVYLNPRGTGQALVYPYYTINGGNTTLLSVVNTTSHGKALKIQFHEGYDGRDVLGFNIYLSPFDFWTAQVVPVGQGAGIFTNDTSCTVPRLPTTAATAQAFVTYAFDGSTPNLPSDGGSTDVTRTREGHFDIIEMGEVNDTTQKTLTAITHVNGVPTNCAQVALAWGSNGYWTTSPNTDMTPPGGGLYGSELIANVSQGTLYAIDAEAIDGFSTTVQHTTSSSSVPDLNTANESPAASASNVVTAMVPLDGQMIQAQYQHPEDAISALFMADSLYNEYVIEAALGAQSDWVITFPTKRFYVDPSRLPANSAALPPFDTVFNGTSCSLVNPMVFDREERTIAGPAPYAEPRSVGLCYETGIMTFNEAASALGSDLLSPTGGPAVSTIYTSSFLAGHMRLGFTGFTGALNHALSPATNSNVFQGLPAIGFLATQYVNGAIQGVLINYNGAFPHRTTVKCVNSDDSQNGPCH